MLHVTQFQPDPSRTAEWLAQLWQGPAPTIVVHRWLYLEDEPRRMVFVWEGDDEAAAWVQERFEGFGVVTTDRVRDATAGMRHAFTRDLASLGEVMRRTGAWSPAELERELELRRRGSLAPDREAALALGRAWAAEGAAPTTLTAAPTTDG